MEEFAVGDSFESFGQLKESVARFEKANALSLYKRDCRSIEAAVKKGVTRDVRRALTYYSLQYACYHGGKKFKSRSSGARPQHRYDI